MKNTVLLIALAGFTTAASAEEFIMSMEGPAVVDGSGVFTIDIIGDSTFGTHMLGGTFGIVNSGDQVVTNMTWTPANWSSFNVDNGQAGGGNYNQVIFGQIFLNLPPPFDNMPAPGSELGERIGSFQITVDTDMGFWAIDLGFVTYDPFTLEAYSTDSQTSLFNTSENLILNGITVGSVPAPSALALLGLGGLAVSQRRR
jgi:MYXO-CTERM domain-containing protein